MFKYICVIKLKINQIRFHGSSSQPKKEVWTWYLRLLENQESPGIVAFFSTWKAWKKSTGSGQRWKSIKCHCLKKCSRGQKLWSTDLAETWHRSWCIKIFQKPIWLTSLTFSFGVSGEGVIFLHFEHQKLSLSGDISKCHKTQLVNRASK